MTNSSTIEKTPLSKLEEIKRKTQKEGEITKGRIGVREQEGKHKRSEWIENAKARISVFLMWSFGTLLVVFSGLVFLAGLLPEFFPISRGAQSLENLFVIVVDNSKTIILLGIGFFFRDYITKIAKSINIKE